MKINVTLLFKTTENKKKYESHHIITIKSMKEYRGQYSINTREYPMLHLVDSTEWNVYCCSPNHCHSTIFNAEPSEAADLAPVFWGNVCSPALLFIFLCLLCLYFPWIVPRLFPCTIIPLTCVHAFTLWQF